MRIILSAVSSQFKECRDALASDLRAIGAEVSTQEDFQQHGYTLLEKLQEKVMKCDRVIALLGDAFGYEPEESLRPVGRRRSYTQWEFFFARGERLDGRTGPAKKVFVYFAAPAYLREHPVVQTPAEAALQLEFLDTVMKSGKDRNQFGSLHELRALVLRDGFSLANVADEAGKSRSPWLLAAALSCACAVMVAAVLLRPYWAAGPCTLEKGRALVAGKRYPEAVRCLEEVIAREPSGSLEWDQLNNPKGAFAVRAQAYESWQGADGSAPQRALALLKDGALANRAQNYQQAIACYEQAQGLDPALFWAANNLAMILAVCPDQARRNPQQAVALATAACTASGWKCWDTLDTLAVAKAAQAEYGEAIALTEQARRLAPQESDKVKLNEKLEAFRNNKPWAPGP